MKRLLATLTLLVMSCGGHSAPTDPLSSIHVGKLIGLVTIGPNCPGPTTTNPCTTPPSAFAARKVLVYDAAHSKVLFTVDIDNGGFYSIDLEPKTYVVDLQPNGIDKSPDVPKPVGR